MFALDRIVVALSAALFLGLGSAFLVWPEAMARVVDIETPTPTAVTDVRAVYGGMNLGIGVYFLLAMPTQARRKPALLLLIAVFAGLVLIRFVGIFVDGPQKPITYLLLTAEIAGLILAAAARWHVFKGPATTTP